MRRILFVSKNYSSDFGIRVGGAFQRLRMLLEACARAGDKLDILFFVDQSIIDGVGPQRAQASLLNDWGIEAEVRLAARATKSFGRLVHLFKSVVDFRTNDDFYQFNGAAQVAAIRSAIRSDTELVFAHRIYLAAAAWTAVGPSVPIVIDLDDIEHRTQPRFWSRPPWSISKALRFLEYPALVRGELATVKASRRALVCSEGDRQFLARKGVTNVSVVANAVRFPPQATMPEASGQDTLFFIGTYSYAPNVEAAEHLVRDIFPRVQDRLPDTRLLIVGDGVERLSCHAAPPRGVEFAGYVPDLDEVYARAAVVCCPIRAGGGTRVKIIEAAARGKPVVSTTVGAEGLDLIDGVEILLRDSTANFVEACVELLTDRARARGIGLAAFTKSKRLYERSRIVDGMVSILDEAVEAAP